MGDRLELADGLAELLRSRACVQRPFQVALHGSDRRGEDEPSLPLHRGVEHRHTAAPPAEERVVGTSQSSRNTSAMGEVRNPILWSGSPTVRPGVDRSTRNAHKPMKPRARLVVAKTRKRSATGALVTKVFEPLRTQPPSTWRRRRRQRERVRARTGLAHAVGSDDRAVGEPWKVPLLLLLGAKPLDRMLTSPHLRVQREDQAVVGAGVAERLERDDLHHDRRAAAAVLRDDRQALDAEGGTALPCIDRERPSHGRG